jgi:hypothetical protein
MLPHALADMSTTSVRSNGDTDGHWAAGRADAAGRPATGGTVSTLVSTCWTVLDALVLAMAAALQGLWGPSPLPCAHAGVYLFNAIDAASSVGSWLGSNERWYNRTGTQVLPKPRARSGVVKWMGDRLDPWQ